MEISLSEIIRDKILKHGPISFRDYMEMALYYPELGYYTSQPEKIGIKGDYYTAPYLTNVYGNVIAKQIEEMWRLTGEKEFTIVEYGAGAGSLCKDLLTHLKNNKQLFSHLNYCIIEKSRAMREKEITALNGEMVEKIRWRESIDELSSFTGCVIANEVLDNFSVHKVIVKENRLMEIFVDHKNGFIETLQPAANNLVDYFTDLQVDLAEGYCAEVNLEAIEWLKNIAGSMHNGFVVTIDYGFSSSELYQPLRKKGTMICYYKHSVNENYYDNIGQQDITTHVNFSALDLWGKRNGLTSCGFTTQSQFLLGLGLTEHLRKIEQENTSYSARQKIMLVYNLLMSMGKKFKVLVQQKGLEHPMLSGLKFSQPLI